jgi:hypothetical protein
MKVNYDNGLTSGDRQARFDEHGANELDEEEEESLWEKIKE